MKLSVWASFIGGALLAPATTTLAATPFEREKDGSGTIRGLWSPHDGCCAFSEYHAFCGQMPYDSEPHCSTDETLCTGQCGGVWLATCDVRPLSETECCIQKHHHHHHHHNGRDLWSDVGDDRGRCTSDCWCNIKQENCAHPDCHGMWGRYCGDDSDCTNADDEYVDEYCYEGVCEQRACTGMRRTDAVTCQTLLEDHSGLPSGYYYVDPDGCGGLSSFEVYCDMVTNGGGWTLFANWMDDATRATSAGVDKVLIDDIGLSTDEHWRALRDSMEDGLLFIDENAKITEIAKSTMCDRNICKTFDQTTSLLTDPGDISDSRLLLFHIESAGCTVTGSDYCMAVLGEGEFGAALYAQCASVATDTYVEWPYGGLFSYNDQNKLKYFVR